MEDQATLQYVKKGYTKGDNDFHWKNSQISKFDQTWISIGFLNIQVNQIPKFGLKLDKSWIFQGRINKLVNPKLVFKKIVIKFVYHKTRSSFSTKTSLEFTEVILLTKPVF